MNWQQHIHVDPAICKVRACITVEAIAASYPPLTAGDVHACMAYAAALAHEELVPLAA